MDELGDCDECGGTGYDDLSNFCLKCGGTGDLPRDDPGGDMYDIAWPSAG